MNLSAEQAGSTTTGEWIEIRVNVPGGRLETVEEALAGAGASAVTVADGGDRPSPDPEAEWSRNRVSGLFTRDTLPPDLEARLSRAAGSPLTVIRVPLEGADWSQAWKEHFSAFPVGERLWVRPSWVKAGAPGRRAEVVLDPGMAFGTGQHPTTRLCLRWLEERLRPEEDRRVLDYGCGSGLLAVAAARLGAPYVLAVDNDPASLQATRSNAEANGVGDRIETLTVPDGVPPAGPFPLVVANILSRTLIELSEELTELTAPGGEIALAGILGPQGERVRSAFPRIHWTREVREGEWIRLDGYREER